MQDFWRRFRRDRLAVIGLGMILLLLVLGLFAPAVAPYDPNQQFFDGLTLEGSPLPPGERFWFGTDTNGRDQFSRLLYGARTSLLIGILANGIAVIIGSFLGVTAGYLRGTAGAAIMRLTDLMMAFPPLLLAIALAAILKPGLAIIILVIALVNWVQIARVIYAETVALSERDYIEAARALGAGTAADPVPPSAAASRADRHRLCDARHRHHRAARGHAVLPRPRRPTAHSRLGHDDLREPILFPQCAPWLVFIPGAAILILALSFNLVGDGLRDALDPTQRDRS